MKHLIPAIVALASSRTAVAESQQFRIATLAPSGTPWMELLERGGATVLSVEAVKKVSTEDRKAIEAIAKRSQKKARAMIRKANEDARTTLARRGLTVVDPSKDMVAELTAIAAAVQSELIGKVYSKEELEMVIAHRDDYRAKQAQRVVK